MATLPGDLKPEENVKRMIRVDHAGEYGALRIYAGQLAVMKPSPERDTIKYMLEQERRHFNTFEDIMRSRKVRPTALMPLWHVAGFALGAATALMGKKAAFACTAAVEEVIDSHYAAQKERLDGKETGLAQTIETFRQEELEHHDIAIENGAEQAPLYSVLARGIKAASKLAIYLSIRI